MSEKIDDFKFSVVDDHAVVEKYYGENTEVIIPEKYYGFHVTHIANECFYKRNITTVIGKSIESIGSGAFYGCTSLTSIEFPICTIINESAFKWCINLISVNLPACESIGYCAFCKCSCLTEIDMQKCAYIDYAAFTECIGLIGVNLPVCEYVGKKAFSYCYSLTTVYLPSCTSIGFGSFYGCKSLINKGKYKATNINLTCRDFQYEIGKWFEKDEAILCEKGFHYVENFYDIFNYYHGKLGEDLRIFEVEAEEISDEQENDSKRVCKRIKLVKEIKSYQEIFKR